jgi:hypothetical protein
MAGAVLTFRVANTMVVVGSIDLALFDPAFAQSIGRSLPGQFMLAYISSIGGGLALDSLQLLKLDWTYGLPAGFKEINGPGSLVFKVLAQATALYMVFYDCFYHLEVFWLTIVRFRLPSTRASVTSSESSSNFPPRTNPLP